MLKKIKKWITLLLTKAAIAIQKRIRRYHEQRALHEWTAMKIGGAQWPIGIATRQSAINQVAQTGPIQYIDDDNKIIFYGENNGAVEDNRRG